MRFNYLEHPLFTDFNPTYTGSVHYSKKEVAELQEKNFILSDFDETLEEPLSAFFF